MNKFKAILSSFKQGAKNTPTDLFTREKTTKKAHPVTQYMGLPLPQREPVPGGDLNVKL